MSLLGRQREFATFGCSRSASILTGRRVSAEECPLALKSDLLEEFGEGPFSKWTGQSIGKPPRAALGSRRQSAGQT
jgi:hypothetical protein